MPLRLVELRWSAEQPAICRCMNMQEMGQRHSPRKFNLAVCYNLMNMRKSHERGGIEDGMVTV